MWSEDIRQSRVAVGSGEIEAGIEYVCLGHIVNVRRDMDVKISKRIRALRKTFNPIKEVLQTKLDNIRQSRIFNSIVLLAPFKEGETRAKRKRIEHGLVMMERPM